MDSRPDTYEHIHNVQKYLNKVIHNLIERGHVHDQTKLKSPEVELFDQYTDKLAGMTYGSKEYNEALEKLKPALDHHYGREKHHPQHYPDGIKGMSLLDLIEMLVDWKSATLRHNNGNLIKSIEHNQQRFNYSDELKEIFMNTIKELGMV